jgi:hypothetical protein
MKQNSRCAWKLLKNLSNNPTAPQNPLADVTSDQIAHQLLIIGKHHYKSKIMKIERIVEDEQHSLETPFTADEHCNSAIEKQQGCWT